jgi:hypothetical protein
VRDMTCFETRPCTFCGLPLVTWSWFVSEGGKPLCWPCWETDYARRKACEGKAPGVLAR